MYTWRYLYRHFVPLAVGPLVACAGSLGTGVRPLTSAERVDTASCASLGTADTLWTAGDLDTPLTVLAMDPPVYPASLQHEARPGVVRFAFVIQPNGRVDPCSLRVVEPTDMAFVADATRSLLTVRFAAPRRGGREVNVRHTQTISFKVGPAPR